MTAGTLSLALGREHTRDGDERAAEHRPLDTADTPVTRVTLRLANAADRPALRRLAELDSTSPPASPALVAEVDGRLRAALPLDGGRPLADPFHRGVEMIELLRIRARQLAA